MTKGVFKALVQNAVTKSTAKGGRSKAKEITIAQGAQFAKALLEGMAQLPTSEVAELLTKYRQL